MEYLIQQVVNALSVGSEYALLALGLAIVFSIIGLVNFAHGELITVAGYSIFFAAALYLPSPWLALPIAVLGAMLAAILFERVAFRAIRNASTNTGILTAFGVSIVVQNAFVIFVATRPKPVATPDWLSSMLEVGTLQLPVLQIVETLVTVVAIVALAVLLKRTTIGLAMRAAAKDFIAVRLMGIKANRVILAAFAISGFLAGLAAGLHHQPPRCHRSLHGLGAGAEGLRRLRARGSGLASGRRRRWNRARRFEVLLQAFLPREVTMFRDAIVFAAVAVVLVKFPEGLLGRKLELGDKEA